jgi:hypothetical protein
MQPGSTVPPTLNKDWEACAEIGSCRFSTDVYCGRSPPVE